MLPPLSFVLVIGHLHSLKGTDLLDSPKLIRETTAVLASILDKQLLAVDFRGRLERHFRGSFAKRMSCLAKTRKIALRRFHALHFRAGRLADTESRVAEGGERFFPLTDPDGHELSFARP
jgi:hypothetical protein